MRSWLKISPARFIFCFLAGMPVGWVWADVRDSGSDKFLALWVYAIVAALAVICLTARVEDKS